MGRSKSGSMHTTGSIVIEHDNEDGRQPSFWDGNGSTGFRNGACHETHPPLHIGGGVLLGGNCRDHQRHQNVNLYVALDSGMQHPFFEAGDDWHTAPSCVYYPIQNMGVPKNPDKFIALVHMIAEALSQGATVHVGCIGGHGRTGLALSAVVAFVGASDDPIQWVRENYCRKAVESVAQEGFLATHFGCPLPPKKSGRRGVDKRGVGF